MEEQRWIKLPRSEERREASCHGFLPLPSLSETSHVLLIRSRFLYLSYFLPLFFLFLIFFSLCLISSITAPSLTLVSSSRGWPAGLPNCGVKGVPNNNKQVGKKRRDGLVLHIAFPNLNISPPCSPCRVTALPPPSFFFSISIQQLHEYIVE